MELQKPSKKNILISELYLIVLILIMSAVSAVLFSLEIIPSLVSIIFTCLWAAAIIFAALIYVPVYYKRLSYTLDEKYLTVNSGVIYFCSKTMPVKSIKYVTVIRGPLGQLFNMSSLIVFAAGSFLILPGLNYKKSKELQELLLKNYRTGEL